ncbi:hypothetical protein [Bradyrhizobium lablabi]|uniref:hypothetical protein n=1 Tax=Bradyrhizobium lablabi TaxID=722472 RepID=UPI0012E3670F|nr:hypothetical protein [Bradyrhizobium lablabi]
MAIFSDWFWIARVASDPKEFPVGSDQFPISRLSACYFGGANDVLFPGREFGIQVGMQRHVLASIHEAALDRLAVRYRQS